MDQTQESPSWCVDMFDADVGACAFVGGRRAVRLRHGYMVNDFLDGASLSHFGLIATNAQRRGLLKSSVLAIGYQQDDVVSRLQRRVGAIVDARDDAQVDCVQIVRVRRGEEWSVARDFAVHAVIALVFLNMIEGSSVPMVELSGARDGSAFHVRQGAAVMWRQTGTVSFSMPPCTTCPSSRWMLMVVVRDRAFERATEPDAIAPTASAQSTVVRNAVERASVKRASVEEASVAEESKAEASVAEESKAEASVAEESKAEEETDDIDRGMVGDACVCLLELLIIVLWMSIAYTQLG